MSSLVMKVDNRYLHMEEMLVGMASWYGYLSKDEVLISYAIEAVFNSYLRSGLITPCRG
jgi:hypothetical protein